MGKSKISVIWLFCKADIRIPLCFMLMNADRFATRVQIASI